MPTTRIIVTLLSIGLFSAGLLTLHGCAQSPAREPASFQGEAPNAIRTLGPDQHFSTLPSQSVARRVREQRVSQR